MSKNRIKISIGERIFDVFNVVFLFALMVVCLYPMLYVLFASLSNGVQLMRHIGLLLRPAGFSLSAYEAVARNEMIPGHQNNRRSVNAHIFHVASYNSQDIPRYNSLAHLHNGAL